MFDDIVKALTIQIKADDLTGGAWSKVGDGVKSVWNNVTALNQAWELGGKIFDKATGLIGPSIEALSRGGAFAETEAAFRALSDSMNVDGDSIVHKLMQISSNTVDLESATKSASNAIRQGFNADQATQISAFAKKYTEAVGGDFIDATDKIVNAIAQGKTKALKEFGIMAEKGDSVAAVLDKMRAKAQQFGSGAFNFGDDWQSIFTAFSNMTLKIEKELNSLVGSAGFGDFASDLRDLLWQISEEAPTIARTIFQPIFDIGKLVFDSMISGPVKAFWGTFFDGSDSVQTVIQTLASFIGNTLFDISEVAADVWWAISSPVRATVAGWIDMIRYIGEETGTISAETSKKLEAWQKTAENFYVDSTKIAAAQSEFNTQLRFGRQEIKAAADAENIFYDATKKASDGLKLVGQGFEETDKKGKKATETKKDAKKAAKELSDETKELAKTYDSLGKSFEGTIKTMGDVVNKTQEGINKTAEQQVDFLATADMFTFGAGQKKDAIEKVMTGLQQQKAEEMRVLEKSADAQVELAKAYTQFSNTPRKVELSAPSGQNVLMALVHQIITALQDLAAAENTAVAGTT